MKSEVVYCWNCKSAMDLKGAYYQCPSCGATWNEVPAPTVETMVVEKIKKGYHETKYRPSRRKSRARATRS